MKKSFAILVALAALTAAQTPAVACDTAALTTDLEWCLKNENEGFGDVYMGACTKDGTRIDRGVAACRTGAAFEAARKNFQSCSAQQKVDAARAIATRMKIFRPGACGS